MEKLTFDPRGFAFDGKPGFLVSGEFHYFRVPKEDWGRRIDLFKEAGGNALATYVPWMIHEPEEGKIVFDRGEKRDLQGFLELCRDKEIRVLLRPGPYQYSELKNDGLPTWLVRDYPALRAKNVRGEDFRESSVSYLHPLFLEKARKYYRAFAETVKPYLASAGGPVFLLQVDNELSGIHLWFSGPDYNPETMGFGREDGRYARFLREKYGDLRTLNAAHGAAWTSFGEVRPGEEDGVTVFSARRKKDYFDFYCGTLAEYAALLASWLREDGIGEPICHNAANPRENALFRETVGKMGKDFLLGSDHYYNLDLDWAQNSPTPQYALRMLSGCETLRAMGMPPTVLEMPGGSPSDTPPILREDLLACYMTNLALGMKGVNYYIYTGGPNYPGTGSTADIYDYNALVRADGTKNETYDALFTFGNFLRDHEWLAWSRRESAVNLGFEWETLRGRDHDTPRLSYGNAAAGALLEKGWLYALMCSRFAPAMVSLEEVPDPGIPLVSPTSGALSETAQKNLLSFVERGGNLILTPVMPDLDQDLRPLSRLSPLFGSTRFVPAKKSLRAAYSPGTGNIYGMEAVTRAENLPPDAEVLLRDADGDAVFGFLRSCGRGKVVFLGAGFKMKSFTQPLFLEALLERLGAKPVVFSENRNIFTSLLTDGEGRRMLFLMNLFSGRQKTSVRVFRGSEATLHDITLEPMEVKTYEL